MKLPYKLITFLNIINLLFLFSFQLVSQNPGHFIFDTSNGLVSDEVYDVEIANNGLIWITTDRGVQSYDGYQFTNYSKVDGLQDNVNFEIFEDDKGILWFNGLNGKISCYKDGKFYGYDRNDAINEFVQNNRVGWISNMIVKDSSILLAGEGLRYCQLLIINESGNQILTDYDEIELEGKKFKYILLKDWVFSFHTKANTKAKNLTSLYNNVCETKHNRSIAINRTSILINFGTYSKIIKFDTNIGFVNNDDENIIWVCTQNGLFSIDLKNNFHLSQYFKNFHTTSVTRDTEGNYWVSTIESGIFLVPSFNFTDLKISSSGSLNQKYLSFGVLDHYLLAGGSGGRIYSIDTNKHVNLIGKSNFGTGQIEKMFDIEGNKLNTILGFVSIKNGKFDVEKSFFNLNYQVYKKDWRLAIGIKGLIISNDKLNSLRRSSEFKTPITGKVRTIFIGDNFFLTGSQDGLYLTKGTDFNETEEIYFDGKPIGRVNSIIKDKSGTCFVLTMSNGVYLFQSEQLIKLEGIDEVNLINDGVFHQNILWLGTNQGLIKYELNYTANVPKIVGKNKYTISDGIPSNYINDLYYFNNDMWLATNKGICYFNPNKSDFQPAEVPLFIKYATANDSITLKDDIQLTYNQNNIRIGYRGVSMKKHVIDPFYRFRLKKNKTSAEWKTTNLDEVQFENLDPGSFTFEINARNYMGEWNKNATSFNFEIKPHFTDRIWFKLLAIFLVLGGLISYFLWILNRNRKRFLIRERLKQTELDARESELSLLRNQMNPHFIFNSLNSIQNLIFKKDDKKANQYLTTFGSLIRKTLEYTKERKISLTEEIEFTIKYLELELMRFPEKFEYTIDNLDEIDGDKIEVPPLLLQPIVENAIIHAFKGIDNKGKISIQIVNKNNDYFQIKIIDNGIGFANQKAKKDHKSIGLSLIRERLELINKSLQKDLASMEILTRNGTEVILNLPKQF
jgi:hypothetical protein